MFGVLQDLTVELQEPHGAALVARDGLGSNAYLVLAQRVLKILGTAFNACCTMKEGNSQPQ